MPVRVPEIFSVFSSYGPLPLVFLNNITLFVLVTMIITQLYVKANKGFPTTFLKTFLRYIFIESGRR